MAPRLSRRARSDGSRYWRHDRGASRCAHRAEQTVETVVLVYQCVSQSLKCCQYSVVSSTDSRYNRMPESKNHFANRV